MKTTKLRTPAELAHAEFARNARLTLCGGVRLDDLRALPTTDEEPFELMPDRRIDRKAKPEQDEGNR